MMANAHFPWLDAAEYPFTSRYFDVGGANMHYIDEGSGPVLLFVHGTPSWSFDFRKVILALHDQFRCIAIDHIGFGLSDKPEHYDYSTQQHAHTLERFILHLDLRQLTLALHDFGGPIGFAAALRLPERIKGMVVLNSWLWSSEGDPDFIKLSKALKSPLLPFLYRRLNFSPRFILPASFGSRKPGRQVLRHYTRPFANHRQRNGALAFARSLLNDQGWFESLWRRRNALAHQPMLFIWGMQDPVVKPAQLARFQAGFPQAQTVALNHSGHFPQEEAPHEVAEAIRGFMASKVIYIFGAPPR